MRALFLFVFLFIYFHCFSQNDLQYLSSTTGAACQSIKYYENYLFTGTGSTLRAYYVGAGHTTPYQFVFEYRYVSEIIRMTIRSHYLYVAANYDGMTKWDITNPALPVKVYDILPDSTDMSTQGMTFKGDTIFVAQYNKICAYKDLGNSFYKIGNVCKAPLFGFITGIAVKNNLCAYTVTQMGGQNGVYMCSAVDFSFISFYQVSSFYTENVIWGKNNNLLHVMAGTNTINGYFFTLDVTNPGTPQKVFEDTVLGAPFGVAMALPYNAENINDTIYVANWGGLKPGGGNSCYIRVYDATNPANVHLLTYLPAGLWHFDLTVNYPKMYVASEWYGIKTVDITNIMNPVDEGNTLTGGWNINSDAWSNYLAVANEGYGFKIYDIADIHNPSLINVNNDPGFCFNACFSQDGNFIYTTNMTYQGFRIYTRNPLVQMGYIQQTVCNGRFLVYQNRIFSKLDNKLNIIDVSNPYSPNIVSTIPMNINDMAISNGKLFVSNNDSILVYNISGSNFQKIAFTPMLTNQDASMLAVFGNELFVYIINKGLVKYLFNNNALTEISTIALPLGAPTYMAADTFGLYLSYRKNGLFEYDRQTLIQTGFYRTGLDYRKYNDMYGVQNLFCKNNLVFLVEYFSQTSLLTGNPDFSIINNDENIQKSILFYPNPSTGIISVEITPDLLLTNPTLMVFSATGNLVLSKTAHNVSEIEINTSQWVKGIYLFAIIDGNRFIKAEKIIVE